MAARSTLKLQEYSTVYNVCQEKSLLVSGVLLGLLSQLDGYCARRVGQEGPAAQTWEHLGRSGGGIGFLSANCYT